MSEKSFAANSLFFAVAKVKPPRKVLDALRHNKRKIQAEYGVFGHIDPQKIALNYCLEGRTDPVDGYRDTLDLIDQFNLNRPARIRHDAVIAAELVFSIPVGRKDIDHAAFFEDCLSWSKKEFKDHPLISADVHLDEATPHMHVLIGCVLPDRLLGSMAFGYGQFFIMRNFRFFDEVAKKHGFDAPNKTLSKKDRAKLSHDVFNKLQESSDPLLQSMCMNSVRKAIENDPVLFAADLGIDIVKTPKPIKRMRTTAEIFTSRGKGPKYEPPEHYPV